MPYDPERHHRRSIRLRGFDYRTPGLYVVTICTRRRLHLFGRIEEGQMACYPAGQMIQQTWDEIPATYQDLDIDAFVVMPNHIHGIVFILPHEIDLYPTVATNQDQMPAPPVGAPPCGRPRAGADAVETPQFGREFVDHERGDASEAVLGVRGRPQGGAPTGDAEESPERLSLSNAMERFKSLTTHRYGVGVREAGWQPYDRKLWQRGFYDRIVRNEKELERFRRYIEANPARWFEDPYRVEE